MAHVPGRPLADWLTPGADPAPFRATGRALAAFHAAAVDPGRAWTAKDELAVANRALRGGVGRHPEVPTGSPACALGQRPSRRRCPRACRSCSTATSIRIRPWWTVRASGSSTSTSPPVATGMSTGQPARAPDRIRHPPVRRSPGSRRSGRRFSTATPTAGGDWSDEALNPPMRCRSCAISTSARASPTGRMPLRTFSTICAGGRRHRSSDSPNGPFRSRRVPQPATVPSHDIPVTARGVSAKDSCTLTERLRSAAACMASSARSSGKTAVTMRSTGRRPALIIATASANSPSKRWVPVERDLLADEQVDRHRHVARDPDLNDGAERPGRGDGLPDAGAAAEHSKVTSKRPLSSIQGRAPSGSVRR
jgi:hypothetical protein